MIGLSKCIRIMLAIVGIKPELNRSIAHDTARKKHPKIVPTKAYFAWYFI
jgi:hypothetical protein